MPAVSWLARVSLLALALHPVVLAMGQTPSSELVIQDAWVRETVAGQPNTAAYLVIENRGAAPTALTAAEVSDVKAVELHTMRMTTGANGAGEMMRMEKVTEIPVPGKSITRLEPGGFHVMLFGVATPLAAGSTVVLTLQFRGGVTKTVTATVRPMTPGGRMGRMGQP